MTDQAIEATEAPEPTVEDRARDMGWRPLSEFKGDESRFVDAETFVKKGEEVLPIVKANARKAEEALASAKAEIAEMRDSFKEFKKYHSQTEQRALTQARKELEREMADAVEARDHRAVREIAADMAALSKDVQTDDHGNPYQSPSHAKTLNQWKGDNPWFGSDSVMTAAANAVANELERSGVKGAEQLAEVAKRMRAEFPQKFENANRRNPAAVEGSTPTRKAGRTWADLPSDARSAGERWVKQGLLTKEQYLRDYFA